MSGDLRVGVAQMNSWAGVANNLAWMEATAAEMAREGVALACFPENAPLLAPERERIASAEGLDGAQVGRMREVAARHSVAVLLGSFAETGPDSERTYNTSVLIDRAGVVAAVYRKVHLFDVEVGPDTTFRESATVAAGPPVAVTADVDGWKVGLSICYDLRFPELYRALSAAGAEVLTVPAAFTFRTGAAHWHTLLRARAIENLSYVLAPAQVGRHYGSRESYGHALVVGPWGDIVSEVEGGVGWAAATLRRNRVDEARRAIPCLSHRRM